MAEQKSPRVSRVQTQAKGRPDWPWYTYPLWYLAYALLWLWAKLCFRFSYSYGPGVKAALKSKEPILLLANHQSFTDPIFVMLALRARPIRFVVGYFLGHVSKLKVLMRALRAIPIQQFVADPTALRHILRALKNQERVLIFPEGQRSIDGWSSPLDYGILRVAAKAQACVITVKLSGAYLAWPRWKQGLARWGKVEARLEVLARAGDWPELEQVGWQQKLQTQLSYDDPAWAASRSLKYSPGRKLAGLDLILHACPACGRAEVMQAEDWHLTCRACGASFKFNGNYQVVRRELATSEAGAGQTLIADSRVRTGAEHGRDGFCPQDIGTWHHWQIHEEGRAWQYLKAKSELELGNVDPAEPDPVLASWLTWQDVDKPELQEADLASPRFLLTLPVNYEDVGPAAPEPKTDKLPGFLRLSSHGSYLEGPEGRSRLPLRPGSLLMFSQGNYVQVKRGEELLRLYPRNPVAVIRLVDLSLYLHKELHKPRKV